ncbi:MAG: hypothetical protein ACFFCW_11055 [Candidatus Hodarchaeota archaeon]
MERCSKCILPAGIPGVTLDHSKKCNYCKRFEEHYLSNAKTSAQQMQGRFERILDRIRGKGRYDCMVPISGGKDSSYVLYILVKKYRMNVLAFNHDHGFQSPQALKNIENAVNKLGVDFVQYRPRPDIMYELFRTFLFTAGEFCTACNMLGEASMYRFAGQNKIRLVFTGNSRRMSSGIEGISPAIYYDRKYFFNVVKDKLTNKQIENFVSPPYFTKAIRRLAGLGPIPINVFEYIRPTLKEIQHTLITELDWHNPGNQIEHGDCLLDPIKNYLMYEKWGCSEITGIYSTLVRNGQITREEALQKAAIEEPRDIPPILPEFLKATDMTLNEFNQALRKDFRQIPNLQHSALFQFCKNLINKIHEIRGYK